MKTLKNQATLLLTGMGICLMPMNQVQAVDVINSETDCSKDLILAFFPETFVKSTLAKFKVPQDQWDGIAKDLAAKDKDVIKNVEDRAEKETPNPLKDPTKQAEAVKIFRETLLQIFSDVLKAHGITDAKQVQDMLDDIQTQKAKRFSECFPQQAAPVTKDAKVKTPESK